MTADDLWYDQIKKGKTQFPASYKPLLEQLAARGWITIGPSAGLNKRGNTKPAVITVGKILHKG